MKAPLSTFSYAIAASAGVIVLLGYFVPGVDLVSGLLLKWATLLASFALIVGVLNLLSVHLKKISQPGGVYSALLVLSFALTVLVVGINKPTGKWSLWVFNHIQVSIESALMALLAITLAYATIRLFRRRMDWMAIIFIATVLITLFGAAPLYLVGDIPILSELHDWISSVPAVAGARGILLGVGLGAVATGLRVLMGGDRPYGG